MVYLACWCGASTAGPDSRCQNADMTVPFSRVNAGRTLPPVLLVTDRVTCPTVASWPVVCTDSIETDSGLGAVRATDAVTRTAQPPPAATHRQCRAALNPRGRDVV